jgi:hypothetical protein
MVLVSDMHHDGVCQGRPIDEEGLNILYKYHIRIVNLRLKSNIFLPSYHKVTVNVGDWVEVQCDYSPGVCSEGGTGVVIAKSEGDGIYICVFICLICL